MSDLAKLDELRTPLPTDLLIVERGGKPYKITIGDLLRVIPELSSMATVANDDLMIVYDASAREAGKATANAVAGVVYTTTTTAAPTTTTTAAPTTTTTAAPTTTTTAP
jgi:hypothetical protein